jgi:hypothetical protein
VRPDQLAVLHCIAEAAVAAERETGCPAKHLLVPSGIHSRGKSLPENAHLTAGRPKCRDTSTTLGLDHPHGREYPKPLPRAFQYGM